MASFALQCGILVCIVWVCNASTPAVWGHTWRHEGYTVARGECTFTFTNTVARQHFKVNVTFETPVHKFQDFQSMDRISREKGVWYYSKSKSQYNPGQEWKYAFDAYFSGNTPPTAVCMTNLDPTPAPPPAPACSIPVVYAHKWNHGGNTVSRGECKFTFTETVGLGQFKVNVTFDRQIENFNNFNVMILTHQEDGVWYKGKSTMQYNPGQEWGYAFDVYWKGPGYPGGVCYSDLGC